MKTSLILLAALAFCSPSFATSPSDLPQGMVPYVAGMRVMHFSELRNSFATDGVPVVCMPGDKTNYNNDCKDAKGSNAWARVETVVPIGWRIQYLHYVMSGGGAGYRQLFIYMVPIR